VPWDLWACLLLRRRLPRVLVGQQIVVLLFSSLLWLFSEEAHRIRHPPKVRLHLHTALVFAVAFSLVGDDLLFLQVQDAHTSLLAEDQVLTEGYNKAYTMTYP